MRNTVTRIADRIGALLALLVVLSALAVYPAPNMPLAGIRQAEATLSGYALSVSKGILPVALPAHATARAPDPAAPDPLYLHALTPALSHLAPPRAASFRPSLPGLRSSPSGTKLGAHPPRAPPFA
ncbi:hypothetical protein CLG85_026015 [Yangia mangrovi]|uniref:Uncharacterized protein n=2 Tax=Alloyangia mangrovi TaxID=1779329 RepID=A0ABT2KTJ0_9RHOB|nr:hypothetical protein [Alloyangia mangrovi]MCA0941603.1 hypothetical protein [Alloyangia pacifica]MCA0947018.1 hypothetical protein [Alloyangia pacifica]MCT4373565.1 hypothetical protein [Alloyangia mangrovi]